MANVTTQHLLSPREIVRGTYEVERFLGEGAFAEVYRVNHRFLGRQAMKVFKASNFDIYQIEKQVEEAILLSKIQHPNIIKIYDANLFENKSGKFGYFTMTYMPGGTLDRYWRAYGHNLMPVQLVVNIVTQIVRGLSIAHASSPPIVHRDIKPQNVLIGFDGDDVTVRISDFGLAKTVNPLTLLASAQGTIEFKPPEAFDDVDSCSADIWAVGTILYLLLTDTMPFPALSKRDLGSAHRFLRPIRPPSQYNVNVDGALESVIYRCLAAKPEDRYFDANELLGDLEKWTPDFDFGQASISNFGKSSKSHTMHASSHDFREEAGAALHEAFKRARDTSQLMIAADLLEEAFGKDPALRTRYEGQLKLWRKGVMHVSTKNFPPKSVNKRVRGEER